MVIVICTRVGGRLARSTRTAPTTAGHTRRQSWCRGNQVNESEQDSGKTYADLMMDTKTGELFGPDELESDIRAVL